MMTKGEDTIPVEPQLFTRVGEYTTFYCEYTSKGMDIHFHFFTAPEHVDVAYWKNIFPVCLDKVAREHFGFEYPRLQASFVEDVLRVGSDPQKDPPETSWWMIVQQLSVPDPDALIAKFLEKLDQALESSIAT
jgi:hypothetical protein